MIRLTLVHSSCIPKPVAQDCMTREFGGDLDTQRLWNETEFRCSVRGTAEGAWCSGGVAVVQRWCSSLGGVCLAWRASLHSNSELSRPYNQNDSCHGWSPQEVACSLSLPARDTP